jgi:hypothetical protein
MYVVLTPWDGNPRGGKCPLHYPRDCHPWVFGEMTFFPENH